MGQWRQGRPWHRLGLTARLLVLVLAGLTVCTALLVRAAQREQERTEEEARLRVLALGRLLAQEGQRVLDEARSTLAVLAQVPQVRAGSGQPCSTLLWNALQEQPALQMVGVAEKSGRVACSALRAPGAVTVASKDFFREALTTGRFTVGNFEVDATTRRTAVHFAQPVRAEDGAVERVLFATLQLDHIERFVRSLMLPEGALVMVWDQQGTLLARVPAAPGEVGRRYEGLPGKGARRDGPLQLPAGDGVARISAFNTLAPRSSTEAIYLGVGIPSAPLLQAVQDDLRLHLFLLWGAGALALAGVWAASHRWGVVPLQTLAETAHRLQHGEHAARSRIRRGPPEVMALSHAVDGMADALQEGERAREAFLVVAAHEMRTPLAALQLQLESAMGLVAQPGLEARRSRVQDKLVFAQRQAWRLTELIRTMTDAQTFLTGELTLQPEVTDVAHLVRSICARWQPLFTRVASPLQVEAEERLVARVDAEWFERMLTQLLSNALRFGAGAPVTVRLEGEGERMGLEVEDGGIGIRPEDQERIFAPFTRAVSPRHYGGLGVGLWMVRRIAEALGGSVTVESRHGEGARFRVELPRWGALPRAHPAQPGPPPLWPQ